jgi:hypothetical protein
MGNKIKSIYTNTEKPNTLVILAMLIIALALVGAIQCTVYILSGGNIGLSCFCLNNITTINIIEKLYSVFTIHI